MARKSDAASRVVSHVGTRVPIYVRTHVGLTAHTAADKSLRDSVIHTPPGYESEP